MAGKGEPDVGMRQNIHPPVTGVMAEEYLERRHRALLLRVNYGRDSGKGLLQVAAAAERRLAAMLHTYDIDAVHPFHRGWRLREIQFTVSRRGVTAVLVITAEESSSTVQPIARSRRTTSEKARAAPPASA